MFNIPVVLFLFKRHTGLEQIIGRIEAVKPAKVYLLADGPRNSEEKIQTDLCRKIAENLITWECEIVKHYAEKNIGVYENIGLGARWVLEREERAIFLEDDNLPEKSFFFFCEELLELYRSNDKVLWICGTNYLGRFQSDYSYVFTQHLLPCGWASWSEKYLKYYDGDLITLDSDEHQKRFKQSYSDVRLYKQQFRSVRRTKILLTEEKNKSSWDYQMLYSLRANGLYGIAPVVNLITNIGDDEFSIHGGTSTKLVMTKRFCEIESIPLNYPLHHPESLTLNPDFDKKTGNIILYPLPDRIKMGAAKIVKKFIGLREEDSLKEFLQRARNGKKN